MDNFRTSTDGFFKFFAYRIIDTLAPDGNSAFSCF